MENKGNILEAYKQFKKDLIYSKEYLDFKSNSKRVTYEDRKLPDYSGMITKTLIIDYGVVNVFTKEQKKLNKELKVGFENR
jgi:hypothetical protein